VISRRNFIALLAGVPLIGKTLLAFSVKPHRQWPIPPGYVQCRVCGEFNGSTDADNLSWEYDRPTRQISVTCLCHGRPCPGCGKMLHRPISNEYDPTTNSIGHTPYFASWFSCRECEAKREEAWVNMPKPRQRIIAERNRELEKLGLLHRAYAYH
jgi:hypothetical protein